MVFGFVDDWLLGVGFQLGAWSLPGADFLLGAWSLPGVGSLRRSLQLQL
jgi:hypothetical protein